MVRTKILPKKLEELEDNLIELTLESDDDEGETSIIEQIDFKTNNKQKHFNESYTRKIFIPAPILKTKKPNGESSKIPSNKQIIASMNKMQIHITSEKRAAICSVFTESMNSNAARSISLSKSNTEKKLKSQKRYQLVTYRSDCQTPNIKPSLLKYVLIKNSTKIHQSKHFTSNDSQSNNKNVIKK
ncbi:hypothetical protein PVAND_012969 [Polypedilum vanderplanki]|uniref:Uncharacterized protein n=1 Tax=Polypedilum vanderplanki TaxID=319348 RepID=A0A9J6CPB2_POLVA|nr:hypothetical protein PVAND_012969 [Polypedilum vanderplanki]